MKTLSAAALLLLLPQDADPDAHRTGSFRTAFKERHPSGSLKEVAKRFGWTMELIRKEDPKAEGRRIEDESFEVCVPASYDRAKPAGLLVWISASGSGVAPPEWTKVLESRNVIVVGANGAGNSRLVWDRARLALDAVHNLGKRYAIDPARIYVTGYSGGGRTASRMGLCYADVFRGGIYMAGMDFYKSIPVTGNPKQVWPAKFPKPSGELLKKTRKESRHVVLVGELDENLPPGKAMAEEMRTKEEFVHVAYFEMPRQGHNWADAEWLEKSLAFLDNPPEPKKK